MKNILAVLVLLASWLMLVAGIFGVLMAMRTDATRSGPYAVGYMLGVVLSELFLLTIIFFQARWAIRVLWKRGEPHDR